ncbi:hypothetical protein CLAIMM_01150 [Cladophialophora immunda]|nr:hypothetical protein CLAIMM_01150 [Cladophialophora immunda]
MMRPTVMISPPAYLCATVLLLAAQSLGLDAAVPKKPNILFILTDDQDLHMESLQHMPLLQQHLVYEGTSFSNHYCTVAICCPSRANLWTGRAAHNLNVTDVFPPYGGYPKVVQEGINDDYLPIWLQEAGYNTYYSGKLWNAHTVDNYDAPLVRGFNLSDFTLDPFTYDYWDLHTSRNGEPPVGYPGRYSPDVTAEKAYELLEEATRHKEPWFLGVAPIAPHSHATQDPAGKFEIGAPKYAERHAHLFKDYRIPRTPNFNPEKQGGVSWMKGLHRLNSTVIAYNDEFQRSRLRALQSVDEMVDKLVQKLRQKNVLEDTYIIYTTDNGYHISQHRNRPSLEIHVPEADLTQGLHPGKECGYETDIHIPLIIRGPGVQRGHVSKAVSSHSDVAPTIMSLVGKSRDNFDGLPIDIADEATCDAERTEHINIEYWGFAVPESIWGKYGDGGYDDNISDNTFGVNNTYKGLRLIGEDYSLYYSVWCTGEKEYYDLKLDPFQLDNYFGDDAADLTAAYELQGRGFEQIWHRLDALMMVLKSCKGKECTDPWEVLHPHGDIKTLKDALAVDFDAFYADQVRVQFESCQLGYILDAEGPQKANVYEQSSNGYTDLRKQPSFTYQGPWSVWT